MRTTITYERKFLINELPDLSGYRKEDVTQWYFLKPNRFVSVRLRRYKDGRTYFDIVFGRFKKRIKLGFKIKFRISENLKLPHIKKTRYKKRVEDVLFVFDIFESGLKILEIESKNENEIYSFDAPVNIVKEVTNDIKYTNNWMSYFKVY